MCFCRWMRYTPQNSNEDIFLTAIKDGITLINYLHLKFKHKPTIQTIIESICPVLFSKIIVQKIFWKFSSKHMGWKYIYIYIYIYVQKYIYQKQTFISKRVIFRFLPNLPQDEGLAFLKGFFGQ